MMRWVKGRLSRQSGAVCETQETSSFTGPRCYINFRESTTADLRRSSYLQPSCFSQIETASRQCNTLRDGSKHGGEGKSRGEHACRSCPSLGWRSPSRAEGGCRPSGCGCACCQTLLQACGSSPTWEHSYFIHLHTRCRLQLPCISSIRSMTQRSRAQQGF